MTHRVFRIASQMNATGILHLCDITMLFLDTVKVSGTVRNWVPDRADVRAWSYADVRSH